MQIAINRDRLLKELGFHNLKMPSDFSGTFYDVAVRDATGKLIVPCAEIQVEKSRSHRGHRIRIKCERCDRLIPTGRYHQHRNTIVCP